MCDVWLLFSFPLLSFFFSFLFSLSVANIVKRMCTPEFSVTLQLLSTSEPSLLAKCILIAC